MPRASINRVRTKSYEEGPVAYMSQSGVDEVISSPRSVSPTSEVVIQTVRQYFPETWLWSIEETELVFS